MSDTEVREEVDYEALSAEELLEHGKSLFKERKYSESAEFFSRALERKSGADPVHYTLREHYLWYADSLLMNEEQSSSLFSSNVNEGAEQELPSAQTVLEAAQADETNQTDELLAFDLFQLAYESYVNYFKDLQATNKEASKWDILDASYCLVRLGDMFFGNHQFEEASIEYARAIRMREERGMELMHLGSLYISLAQSQMFNGKLRESLETFNKTKEILAKLVEEEQREEDKKNLENTLEDITIQAEDLRKLINETSNLEGQQTKGSQSNAASLVPKTTSTLDERQLDPSVVKARVIDIGVGEPLGKKRRIDLSKVYE